MSDIGKKPADATRSDRTEDTGADQNPPSRNRDRRAAQDRPPRHPGRGTNPTDGTGERETPHYVSCAANAENGSESPSKAAEGRSEAETSVESGAKTRKQHFGFPYSSRKTGSRAFRRLLLEAFPGSEADPAFIRLVVLLIDALAVDGDDDRDEILIHGPRLAAVMESETEYRSGNLRGDESTGRFLSRFRRSVVPDLRWNRAVHYENRARSIDRAHLQRLIPERVVSAWKDELATKPSELRERVYLSTGTAYGDHTRYREGKRRDAILDPYEYEAPNRVARKVYRLMRLLPKQQFTRLVKDNRLGPAYKVAASLKSPAREQAFATLRELETHRWQNYGFSAHSPRVWGQGHSLAQVDTRVRRAVLHDSIELDLRSSQLAIAARDWELPLLTEFLANGRSIWNELMDYLGLPRGSALKKALKAGTYGLVYGAGPGRIRGDVEDEYQSRTGQPIPLEDAAAFLEHPLMREVMVSRDDQLARIRSEHGAENCFGQWICDGKSYGNDFSRSVLAQCAQARELWLMEPLVDLGLEEAASPTRRWYVTLWQHDGVSIRLGRGADLGSLQDAASWRARKYGYNTELETKYG